VNAVCQQTQSFQKVRFTYVVDFLLLVEGDLQFVDKSLPVNWIGVTLQCQKIYRLCFLFMQFVVLNWIW